MRYINLSRSDWYHPHFKVQDCILTAFLAPKAGELPTCTSESIASAKSRSALGESMWLRSVCPQRADDGGR